MTPANAPVAESLFDTKSSGVSESTPPLAPEPNIEATLSSDADDSKVGECGKDKVTVDPSPTPASDLDLYGYFLLKLEVATRDGPLTVDALQEKLGLVKAQLNEWLKLAVSEARAEKSAKPVRYQTIRTKQLF